MHDDFLGEQPVTTGWFAGISTLAVVAAFNDTNGGLYMALMKQYGSAEDAAAYSVMSIESGPFFTMLGYDLTDPRECLPEYKADFGKDRSTKPIDWGFKHNSAVYWHCAKSI